MPRRQSPPPDTQTPEQRLILAAARRSQDEERQTAQGRLLAQAREDQETHRPEPNLPTRPAPRLAGGR